MKLYITILSVLFSLYSAQAAESYHVAGKVGTDRNRSVAQLAITTNNILCVLEHTGTVTLFAADGSLIRTFSTGLKATEAMAVAPDGNLYVLETLMKKKKIKVRARMRTINVPNGVNCILFDLSGKRLMSLRLDGLMSAQAAHVVAGKLVVADPVKKRLVFFDIKTCKQTATVERGLRLCCDIFDFCEAPNETISVANLGAFSVSRYDLNGKLIGKFGRRGRGLDEFHGCCNPVSVGYLPNGRIVSVEKDPTRIKIYDADAKNAQKIEGVEELVKGCSFIPMAIDSAGTIYLAAEKGYIVKCIPKGQKLLPKK